MQIACPIYPAKIIELIAKINIKFLLDIPNFAERNEIKTIEANAKIDGFPKNKSRMIFFMSNGSIYCAILI